MMLSARRQLFPEPVGAMKWERFRAVAYIDVITASMDTSPPLPRLDFSPRSGRSESYFQKP